MDKIPSFKYLDKVWIVEDFYPNWKGILVEKISKFGYDIYLVRQKHKNFFINFLLGGKESFVSSYKLRKWTIENDYKQKNN